MDEAQFSRGEFLLTMGGSAAATAISAGAAPAQAVPARPRAADMGSLYPQIAQLAGANHYR